MLILERRRNQRIFIGENITINVARIKGGKVWIGIDAPREIAILREEVADLAKAAEEDFDELIETKDAY